MQPTNNLKTSFFNLIKNDTPYLALFTSAPTVSGGGTEVTGGSYERKAITFGNPNLTTNQMQNTAPINFSAMPTANVTHYAVMNAATGGVMKAFGSLAAVNTISGDEITIATGNVTVTFSGA